MIALERQLDIQFLHRQGCSASQIARKLGIDRRTVKNYLDHPEQINQPRKTTPRHSKGSAHETENIVR